MSAECSTRCEPSLKTPISALSIGVNWVNWIEESDHMLIVGGFSGHHLTRAAQPPLPAMAPNTNVPFFFFGIIPPYFFF
jgi:hypothetical protein